MSLEEARLHARRPRGVVLLERVRVPLVVVVVAAASSTTGGSASTERRPRDERHRGVGGVVQRRVGAPRGAPRLERRRDRGAHPFDRTLTLAAARRRRGSIEHRPAAVPRVVVVLRAPARERKRIRRPGGGPEPRRREGARQPRVPNPTRSRRRASAATPRARAPPRFRFVVPASVGLRTKKRLFFLAERERGRDEAPGDRAGTERGEDHPDEAPERARQRPRVRERARGRGHRSGSIPQVVVHRERREGPRGTPGSPPRKSMKKRTRRRRRRVRRFLRDVERGVKRVLPRQHRREVRARARAPARLRPTPRPPAPAPAPRRCRWGRPRPRAAELELGPLGLTLGLAAGPPAAAVGILAIIVPGILVFLRALAQRRPERRRRRREERVPDPSPGIARGRREGPGTRRRPRLHRAREPRGHVGGDQRARHLREVVGVERGHQRVPERRGERDRGRVLRVRGRVVGVVPTRRSFFWVPPRETYALGSGDPASRLGTAFGFAPPHQRLR